MMAINTTLRTLRTTTALLSALHISACGVGGAGGDESENADLSESQLASAQCSIESMRSWAYDNMKSYYLFADQVSPNVQLSDYDSAEELVTALRVQPFDRFSNIQDQSTQAAFFNEGENFGFGWRLIFNTEGEIVVSFIEPGSPLDLAGIQRGDVLVSLDGYSTEEYLALPTETRLNILGTGTAITSPTLGFRKSNGFIQEQVVTKATFSMQTVTDVKAIDHAGTRVGYLSFYQFVETSKTELANAFATLANESITELVLDLRFNGGGRISVANELASYIVGDNGTDQVFSSIIFNDANSDNNSNAVFEPVSNALNLSRVYVLAGPGTCSASEMVINGLSPFVEVVIVGESTCGKPYGTRAVNRCGKSMNAVEVEFQNANGFGGYYEGFDADCSVSDSFSAALGSSSESLFATALDHISTGSCNVLATGPASRNSVFDSPKLPDELKPPVISDKL